jgi:hypothetical protein
MDDINLTDYKMACKNHKCTITNAAHSILGKTIKEYADLNNDPTLSKITIASTFSTEPFPKRVEDVVPRNTWVPQYLQLPVGHDLKKLIAMNIENSKNTIGSSMILGMNNFIRMILYLPFGLPKLAFLFLSKKLTMTYSGVPGPKKNWVFDKWEANGMSCFIPSVGDMLCGII